MSKDEFLTTLDKKLQVINESERRDIIDEYHNHIDMKMKDGKSEEEAIKDFGDIDELVDEILDAYKINTEKVNQSFDRKFNHFMDDLYDGFKRFIGSITSLDVDDVVRVIFEVLIVLLIMVVVHFVFSIIGGIGSGILESFIGFGIGHFLSIIWRIVIELAFVVIFVVVIVNVVNKRVKRYRNPNKEDNASVFDDVKDSFHFDQTRASTRSNKESEETSTNHFEESESETENKEDDQEETEPIKETNKKERQGYETSEDRKKERSSTSFTSGITGFVHVLLKIFFCLMMIPFIGIIIGLCCALGAMVVISIQGFSLIGAYCLVIGGLFVCGAFISLLYSVLWRIR